MRKSSGSATRCAAEGLDEYIARLESIDASDLSADDQLALSLSLQIARKKRVRAYLTAEVPQPSALDDCKEMIRNLSRTERLQLLVWLQRYAY